jgi:hypothetical protein
VARPPQPRLFRVAAAAALLVLALVACGKKQADPAAAARVFFEQISRGDLSAAYKSTAFNFQSQQTEKSFAATCRELELVGAKITQVDVPENDGANVRLNVALTTAKGAPAAYSVTLQVESRAWRILTLRSPRNPKTGVSENRFSLVGKPPTFNDAPNREVPNDREMRRLVRGAMASFGDSIKRESFAGFYAYVSQAWRTQLTERKLQAAFQSFIDQKVDLGGVADVDPIFDAPPHISTDGLLHVAGHYPTKPYKVRFAFKFIYELPEWKLFGLDVYLLKDPVTPAASPLPAATPAPAPH